MKHHDPSNPTTLTRQQIANLLESVARGTDDVIDHLRIALGREPEPNPAHGIGWRQRAVHALIGAASSGACLTVTGVFSHASQQLQSELGVLLSHTHTDPHRDTERWLTRALYSAEVLKHGIAFALAQKPDPIQHDPTPGAPPPRWDYTDHIAAVPYVDHGTKPNLEIVPSPDHRPEYPDDTERAEDQTDES